MSREVGINEIDIREIGKRTNLIAEHNRRTHSSFIDMLFAFQHLGVDIFSFGSYVTKEDKLFIEGVPEFPVRSVAEPVKPAPENPERPYIPGFLPDLPETRTYKKTAIYQKRHVNNAELRNAELEVRHNTEESLIDLKNKVSGDMKVNYKEIDELQQRMEEGTKEKKD